MSVECMDDGENVPRSSQGRIGEGCSTPQCMANNTFAPLREIDVSAVTPLDAVSHEVFSSFFRSFFVFWTKLLPSAN